MSALVEREREEAVRQPLGRAVAQVLGHRLDGLRRLTGGSKKGVYRLHLDGGASVIAYLWSAEEDFWPERPDHAAAAGDPLAHPSGLDLFEAAHHRLDSLGLRTPRLLHADRSHTLLPADLALVEDLPLGSLEPMLEQDPAAARPVLDRLAHTLDVLHGDTAPRMGKVAQPVTGPTTCEQLVLDRALRDLAEAADREPRLAAVRGAVADLLHTRAAEIRPRTRYRLIHGELGPDHVLVDRRGEPVLIDIEGLMYFDVEWEHVFLRIRFRDHYPRLATATLDPHRLALYEPAMRLSLVAGPLRLLDGGFPGDRAVMRGIAAHNLEQLLAGLG
ncbi:phosphotransferase [Kitasatospora sp. NPDC006697]|uniref:phosphotransferase n=1 Tax=Kitasatospora sp. NPDC006697 TaxID=3364020 RepID=UPI0036B0A5A0